jgi:carbon monoxide dehydrogenase subunit G
MQFSGSVEIAAPRATVWDFVSDPEKMGSCGPGVETVETIDENKFLARAKVKVGPIAAKFTVDAEFVERIEPDRAVVRARGKAPGSAVDGTAEMSLRDGDQPDTTAMDWSADVQISGMMASLGARMIEGTAYKLIGETFTCVKSKLEVPGAVQPTPPPEASEPEVAAVVAAEPEVAAVVAAEPEVPALPAVPEAVPSDEPAPRPFSQPVSVAFLPLALAAFVIIAFVMAAWTFLAAA